MKHTKKELERQKELDKIFMDKLKKFGFPKIYNHYKEDIEKRQKDNYKAYMEEEFFNAVGCGL